MNYNTAEGKKVATTVHEYVDDMVNVSSEEDSEVMSTTKDEQTPKAAQEMPTTISSCYTVEGTNFKVTVAAHDKYIDDMVNVSSDEDSEVMSTTMSEKNLKLSNEVPQSLDEETSKASEQVATMFSK